MSTIRKQSIISSVVVYLGFALGFFNTYLFTREGGFTKEQYGLTATFIAIANIMYSVANLGMPAYISKFFPYYKARLGRKENDILTWGLLLSSIGFLFVILFGFAFKNAILERFSNSPGIEEYYNWIFPFGFGLTIYMLLETYAWQHRKSILTNFLREALFRVFITILIVFTTIGIIKTFDVFIKLYALLYIIIAAILFSYLFISKKVTLVFKPSIVTKKYFNKIVAISSFVWTGGLVFNVSTVFDSIVIAAVMPNGLAMAGIYSLAQNISSLVQAPQRGIIAASIGALSQAWKDKDMAKIDLIYHRSSINQLVFSTAMFCLIWLNFEDGVFTFRLQQDYLQAKVVFLFIGLYRIIDMGTGLNAQIIATSTFWRFEFLSGLVLFALALPLNYFLTRYYGLIGPAISNLIAFSIYNFIRYFFLLKKFNLQPFTINSLYTVVLAFVCYYICYWLFDDYRGLVWIIIRSTIFLALFASAALLLKLSPDVHQIWSNVLKKFARK
jgi:O-antigen/teichoic acid export membrane protein